MPSAMFTTSTPSPIASSSRVTLDSAMSTSTPTGASAITTPSRRSTMNRTPSSRSELTPSNDRNRHWTPATQAIPLSSVEGKEGKGGLMGKTNLGDAERGLSSLFVQNERSVGTKEGIGVKKRKKTWGGSFINGAMNATVFGAALGLTAYRMWSGDERPPDPAPVDEPPDASPPVTTASLRSRPDSVEFPPPPAYSETLHTPSQLRSSPPLITSVAEQEEDEWVDVHDKPLSPLNFIKSTSMSPSHSPRHTRYRSMGSKSSLRKGRAMERKASEISVEQFRTPSSVSCDPFDRLPPSPLGRTANRTTDGQPGAQSGQAGTDEEEDIMDPLEVSRRLDELVDTLKKMIEDGTKALAEPCPDLSTDIWVDQPSKLSPGGLPRSSYKSALNSTRKSLGDGASPASSQGIPEEWKQVKRRPMMAVGRTTTM